MYCNKCGKQLQPGDAYCSGCGQKAAKASASKKKGSGWLILLVCVAAILFFTTNRREVPQETYPEETAPSVVQIVPPVVDTLPEEPYDGDVLENSDYADGEPRRRVSDYGDVYVTDYRNDGTMLRESILYYSNGVYSAKRVTNYDTHGNPTDTTERMADGQLWLYIYYENTYDPEGRPAYLIEYNRMGCVLSQYIYVYNEDGSYCMNWEQYRGPVYEYDFADNPKGETYLFSYGYTTFTAEGDVVDQMILDAEN